MKRQMWLLLAIVIAIVAGTYVYFRIAGDSWQPPRVVKIESKEPLASLFPTWIAWQSDAEEGMPQALLLRDGDYIIGKTSIPYRASDGQTLKLSFTDWQARIGETTVAVLLNKNEGLAWLIKASGQELANVRTISLPTTINAATLAALKRLAAANPHVDLWGESEASMLQALPLFRPRAVFFDKQMKGALRALANQPELETLQMEAVDPGCFEVLPTLPKLRRLIIVHWDVNKAGPLPGGLTNLKTLLVMESKGIKDLTALRSAPAELEELSLLGMPDLKSIDGLDKLTRLRTLALWNDNELSDLSSLNALTRLRWVSLPSKTTQEQFAAFANAHPKLKILDLMGNKNVTNLAPLSAMKGLEGLILNGPYKNLDAVRGLTSLRFLGISEKILESSPEQVAAVRKALPDCLVVRVKPLCLGSGWLMLLVPLLGVIWLVRRQPHQEAQPS